MWVKMEGEYLVSSALPSDLFRDAQNGLSIVAPWFQGYVVEIARTAIEPLLNRIRRPSRVEVRVDISRVVDIFPIQEIVTDAAALSGWQNAQTDDEGRREFVAHLPPFRDRAARADVFDKLSERLRGGTALLVNADVAGDDGRVIPSSALIVRDSLIPAATLDRVLAPLKDAYQAGRHPRITVSLKTEEAFRALLGQGLVVRWDPIAPLAPARPGQGPEPEILTDPLLAQPIVGVIDGGLTAARYAGQVAWQAQALFDAGDLDRQHGNCVSALIVDGHIWNNDLRLPPLYCRLGIVPAVPRSTSRVEWSVGRLVAYLEEVIQAHQDTKVWNLSANVNYACDSYRVSELGHQLSLLARKHAVLFVISSGNRDVGTPERIAPPADSEAALTVAGRLHDVLGDVEGACPVSRTGLGPEDMLKPELSWFSTQRLLGGGFGQASSYAAPLVSRLAAHTWAHLREPIPDTVRGLMINAADRADFDYRMGYGSPTRPELPWETPDNAVIFCWHGTITEKARYYWTGLKLPPSLTRGGLFRGRVKVVCLLEPFTHMRGTNYVSNRLQIALQFKDGQNKWRKIAGGVPTETEEGEARSEDAKWQPIRCYQAESSRGVTLGGNEMRLSARMFWRDRYLYPTDRRDVEATVSFVVTLESLDRNADVYSEFVAANDLHLTSAVIEPTIEPDVDLNVDE